MPSPAASPSASASPSPSPSPSASPSPLIDNQSHLYVMDAFGGVHPAGTAATLRTSAYWDSWDIARGTALLPDGSGGYVLDGWGGLHQLGAAPPLNGSAYWRYWDIARAVALTPWSTAAQPSGYVLDGWGGLHEFGGAPPITNFAYWKYFDIAKAIVILPDSTPTGVGGYVLDGWGGLHAFGDAPPLSGSAYWKYWDIARSLSLSATSTHASPGGYVLDGWGGLHPFGSAPAVSGSAYWSYWDIARSVVTWTRGPGGWVLDGWGGLHEFGGAPAMAVSAYWRYWDIARGMGNGSSSRAATSPNSNTIAVPWNSQWHHLSCEAANLQMIARFYGRGYTQDDIMNYLGEDLRRPYWDAAGLHWGDPYVQFVGDVNGSEGNYSGYGMKYPPLLQAANHYGLPVLRAGENLAPVDLYAAIEAGHPAVVWGSADYVPHTGVTYSAFDGRTIFWGRYFEHVFVVTSVSPTTVGILDPLRNSYLITLSKEQFERQWSQFYNAGIIFQ